MCFLLELTVVIPSLESVQVPHIQYMASDRGLEAPGFSFGTMVASWSPCH